MPAQNTTATTSQPPPPAPTPVLPVNGETAGWLGVVLSGFVYWILHMRRKTSRDNVELLKDRTEGALLKTALQERDKAMADAREAWSKANADAGTIGQLRAENEYLKRELSDARALIAEIRHGVQQVGRKVDVAQSNLTTVEKRVGSSGSAPLGEK